MPYSEEEVAALLENGMSATVDYLPDHSPADRIAESLAALANAEGGVLLLGVSPKGAVTGVDDPDAVEQEVLAAFAAIEPPLGSAANPDVVEHNGHSLVLVRVARAVERVHQVGGRFLQRQGAATAPMGSAEIQQLLLQRRDLPFERMVPDGAETRDVSRAAVEQYVEDLPDFDHAATGLQQRMSDLLRRKGILRPQDGRPTYAGLLLFGREPQQWLPSAQILFAFYLDTQMGDTFQRQQIDGTLPQQIQKAESFILANMRRGVVMEGLQRIEKLEYPRAAVREAIVNAVAHRDYSIRGAETQIFMFADRIEFLSPGKLPGHVTVDNILGERFSRNEALVQVLSDMGFIERLGYGIDRIFRLMAENGLPEPKLEETANGFKLTLFGPGDKLMLAPSAPATTSLSTSNLAKWNAMGLNSRQVDALLYVERDGRITNRDFQELAPDVTAETLRRDLADLVERGLLLKIGEKKATFYILK
jgi:ATP-dependent DNA helicase RecG